MENSEVLFFASGDAVNSPCFGYTLVPSREESPRTLARLGSRRGADLVARALVPESELQGWFLAPPGVEIRGIRALSGDRKFVARRKQIRPEVHARHLTRPDAINSGFTIAISLQPGWNSVVLQYKDERRQWHTFSTCNVQLPWLWRATSRFARRGNSSSYETWLSRHGDPGPDEQRAMEEFLPRFPRRPLISVLMPVHNPPERWLCRAIESVQRQIYPHWELCIADDHSTEPHVRKVLQRYASRDARVKVVYRETNGHISHASNSALELCTGEFTALLDHDDELGPHALYHVAWELANHPDANVIFSDEDKVDENGVRGGPYFKPGWNYDLLLGQNCVSHLGAFRTELLREIGGFRPGLEGSQDWDISLRAVERGGIGKVRHIPRVLYHWRTHAASTASDIKAKPYARAAGQRSVEEHLRACSPGARLRLLEGGTWQVLWPLPDPELLVSLIIPTHNHCEVLRDALDSHFALTDYPRVEVIIVDHDSNCPETLAYLSDLATRHPEIQVQRASGAFNWSALSNQGARQARGEVLIFLNNDVRITSPEWLGELARQAWRPDVGAVGACLLYENGAVQHAGVVLNMTGVAGHVFRHSPPGAVSIGGGPDLVREVTAVTGACLAVRRENFERAGGFDQEELRIGYSDVDFCLRLRQLGLRNVYTPFARLVHHESFTRHRLEATSERKSEVIEEVKALLKRWPREFEKDAFYNQNLTLGTETPMPTAPRVAWPWKHSVLRHQGGPDADLAR